LFRLFFEASHNETLSCSLFSFNVYVALIKAEAEVASVTYDDCERLFFVIY